VELMEKGFDVVIADDLSNSSDSVIEQIGKITGKKPAFACIDLCDTQRTKELLAQHRPDAAIHFAAYKAVGESVQFPVKYYRNNINSLLSLLEEGGVQKIVFSSSCAVYGEPESLPVHERLEHGKAQSPYARTKQICEDILRDITNISGTNVISLRYFNPAGAHHSGLIGELPIGAPNNLVPIITQIAAGKRKELSIFGNDYPTPDGTCVRDYIHVTDIAKAHVTAIERLLGNENQTQFEVFNLGTGKGMSVLEIVNAFRQATGLEIPYRIAQRRPGDVAQVYADTRLANENLKWKAEKTLDEMLKSAWIWEQFLMQRDIEKNS
jgi:UDP-glucose 4-epimerase